MYYVRTTNILPHVHAKSNPIAMRYQCRVDVESIEALSNVVSSYTKICNRQNKHSPVQLCNLEAIAFSIVLPQVDHSIKERVLTVVKQRQFF